MTIPSVETLLCKTEGDSLPGPTKAHVSVAGPPQTDFAWLERNSPNLVGFGFRPGHMTPEDSLRVGGVVRG